MLMKKYFAVVFLLVSISYPQGKIHTINSDLIPYTDTLLVFTPVKSSGTPLPAVILLHGYSGDYTQWSRNSNLQEYADIYNCIIITPSGFFDSWYINSPLNNRSQYESYFTSRLLPYIINTLRADSAKIFLSGLSMGGFGAISLILHFPDKIKAAASTSGVLNLEPFIGKWGLPKILGSGGKIDSVYKLVSPLNRLNKSEKISNILLIDCGTEDFAYTGNVQFYQRAVEMGYNITFISRPGNHTHQYWKQALPYHFLFFSKLF